VEEKMREEEEEKRKEAEAAAETKSESGTVASSETVEAGGADAGLIAESAENHKQQGR
jgi:hypothetical protein